MLSGAPFMSLDETACFIDNFEIGNTINATPGSMVSLDKSILTAPKLNIMRSNSYNQQVTINSYAGPPSIKQSVNATFDIKVYNQINFPDTLNISLVSQTGGSHVISKEEIRDKWF